MILLLSLAFKLMQTCQLDKSLTIARIKSWVFFWRRRTIYAIVATGGKQLKVSPGQTVDIELIEGEEGGEVELDKVLFVDDGENLTIGKPTVDGAKVRATIVGHGRQKKIIVFKYKSKTRYRRKKGHRQYYTRLSIDEIVLN